MEFVDKVKEIMNDAGWSDEDFIGDDDNLIESHIRNTFRDVWMKAVSLFPESLFVSGNSTVQPIGDVSEGTGYVVLPTDFYKLIAFKMNGWFNSCTELLDNSPSLEKIQSNEWTRGNICRPICVRKGDKLYYYSLPKGMRHTLKEFKYIPLVGELSGSVINERLFVPLAYLSASLIYMIFEKEDISKALEQKALEYVKI